MLAQDLRFALRSLLKTPSFTAIAVLTLAIGIGANIGVFSLANAYLLRPYPYAEPEQLIRLRSLDLNSGTVSQVSFPDYVDLARGSQLIDGFAAVDREAYNLGGGAEAVYVQGAQVTATLFDVLGTRPLFGRTFLPDEDLPGADNVVILSETLWRNNFAADNKIVGSTVTIDAEPYTVIGVMPSGGGYPDEASLWVTLRLDPGAQQRGNRWANIIARLAPGATIGQARDEVSTLAATLAEEFPDSNTGFGVLLVGLYESRTDDIQARVMLLLGSVGFVLLIVCANVANLLLARAASREREMAVRAAMGAGAGRLVRQLFTESALLSLGGAVLGLGLGTWAVSSLALMSPAPLPEWLVFTVDWRVVTYAAGPSIVATLVFGLVPAIRGSRTELNESLKETATQGSATARKQRARSAIVVAEVALAIILLVGAGLTIRSFLELTGVDTGYDDSSFMLTTAFADANYANGAERVAFYDDARERLLALPGVLAVGGIAQPPLRSGWMYSAFVVEGTEPDDDGANPGALKHHVTPGHIEAAGISLLRSRDFVDSDSAEGTPEVALVNDVFADRFWPGEDPIGKRFRFPDMEDSWIEIVGVTESTKQRAVIDEAEAEIFYPYERLSDFYGRMTWVVRSGIAASGLMAAAQAEIRDLDPNQALYDVMTMRQAVHESVWGARFFSMLLWIFGGVALTLSATGIYGLVSYSVSQRRHEIGVRIAMGATAGDVLGMVLRHGVLLAGLGAVIGFAGSAALGRLIASELYGVDPLDPITYSLVAGLLGLVAITASLIPAARASRVDPLVALRDE